MPYINQERSMLDLLAELIQYLIGAFRLMLQLPLYIENLRSFQLKGVTA